ncbi:MAG: hypothetical protein LBU81_00950 [Methanosarcinales archaeon]|nr:hypothetical protein [Methanosarcinales archaeon]
MNVILNIILNVILNIIFEWVNGELCYLYFFEMRLFGRKIKTEPKTPADDKKHLKKETAKKESNRTVCKNKNSLKNINYHENEII